MKLKEFGPNPGGGTSLPRSANAFLTSLALVKLLRLFYCLSYITSKSLILYGAFVEGNSLCSLSDGPLCLDVINSLKSKVYHFIVQISP